jgi:hypothetical protein
MVSSRRQHLRREIFGGGDNPDRDPAAGERFQPRQPGGAISQDGVDPLGSGQNFLARAREPQAAAVALEQRQAYVILELTHLHGDRRRRHVAGLGGRREAAAARRRREQPQLLDRDVAH